MKSEGVCTGTSLSWVIFLYANLDRRLRQVLSSTDETECVESNVVSEFYARGSARLLVNYGVAQSYTGVFSQLQ